MIDFPEDDDDEVARAMAIRFEEKGGVYYNNDDKINHEKVAVADMAQYVAERTLSQYEEEFEVICFKYISTTLRIISIIQLFKSF